MLVQRIAMSDDKSESLVTVFNLAVVLNLSGPLREIRMPGK